MSLIELTRTLIGFNTINPPGNEPAAARYIGQLLEKEGFAVDLRPFGEGRANLIARRGPGHRPPLCFTGHLDTVPLGSQPWTRDPFAGEIEADRLYGRGATDMKGAVAAFLIAAIEESSVIDKGRDVLLLITAGEETGSDGARALMEDADIERPQMLIVAEPTSNRALFGHKGALWLNLAFDGVTAHGSMPEKGRNAVVAAARAVTTLAAYQFDAEPHAVLGRPTLNIGTFHGGLNTNSVPDRAEIGIDIRTVPGMSHARLQEDVRRVTGPDSTVSAIVDLPAVWTLPDCSEAELVRAATCDITGEEQNAAGATYFTDASVFTPAFDNVPTFILGPGEASMAHKTDEYVLISRLHEAVRIYRELIRRSAIS